MGPSSSFYVFRPFLILFTSVSENLMRLCNVSQIPKKKEDTSEILMHFNGVGIYGLQY